jgi:hypothetical protein
VTKPVVDLQAKLDAVAPAPLELVGRTAAELLAETPETPDWLVPGLFARGWTIKIAAREKTGKGTFVLYLLGCLERREATLFGDPPAEPVTALIYTEEPADSMREKVAASGLRRARIIYGWELRDLGAWPAKVAYLAAAASAEGHGVVFVDNISRAAGADDEAGTELARAAETLSEAMAAAGITTIVDHHHRKAAGKTEDKSRGGTALAGAMDSNVEIERVGDWLSRVRKVSSRGRLRATNWERQIALSDDGSSYDIVADVADPQLSADRQRLALLRAAPDGLTCDEFQESAGLSKSAAYNALRGLVTHGWAEEVDGRPKRWRALDVETEEPRI